jgi:hypothetical protein
MLLLSLNIRGIGGTLKLASVRRVLDKTRPELVLFQETMVLAEKARDFMFKIRPNWLCCAVNSDGSSGGLMVSWDPNFFYLNPSLTCGGIFLSGFYIATRRQVNILNTYGPCVERKVFWERLGRSGLLSYNNLILMGDLNLTLSSGEIWGGVRNLGCLAGFFKNFFLGLGLIDILPGKLVPTWRNNRAGT